jgi:hypothetical protein
VVNDPDLDDTPAQRATINRPVATPVREEILTA